MWQAICVVIFKRDISFRPVVDPFSSLLEWQIEHKTNKPAKNNTDHTPYRLLLDYGGPAPRTPRDCPEPADDR